MIKDDDDDDDYDEWFWSHTMTLHIIKIFFFINESVLKEKVREREQKGKV